MTLTDEDVQPVEDIVPCDSYNPVSDLAKLSPSSTPESSKGRVERGKLFMLPGVIALAFWSAA